MILKFVRSVIGYVEFKISGGYPEKFINLCVKGGHNLWDMRKLNGDLFAKIHISEYKHLHKKVRKSNSKIKIIKKYGMPFLFRKYKRRVGIIVGIMVFMCIICILSSLVWRINIVGCKEMNPKEVEKVINELGISAGTPKYKIDVAKIKQEAMIKLENISWISINIHGSDVDVVLKEKNAKPDLIKNNEPCNIVAECDGQIERLETYKGVPVVNSGDVVVKGQLLISGIVEEMSGENEFVCAGGKIFAKTFRVLSESIKIKQAVTYDTGNMKTDKKLKFSNFEIPINFKKPGKAYEKYRCEDFEKDFDVFGIKLPIKFMSQKMYEQREAFRIINEEEATEMLKNLIDEKEKNEFGSKIVIKNRDFKNVIKNEENGVYTQECRYECVEDISKKEKILLESEE